MHNQTMQLKKHTHFFALCFFKSNVKTEAYPFGVLNKNVMDGAHFQAIDLTNRCEAVARLFFAIVIMELFFARHNIHVDFFFMQTYEHISRTLLDIFFPYFILSTKFLLKN